MKKTTLTMILAAVFLFTSNVSAQQRQGQNPGHKGPGTDAPLVQRLVHFHHIATDDIGNALANRKLPSRYSRCVDGFLRPRLI